MNIITSKKAVRIFLIQFIFLFIVILISLTVFFLLEPVSFENNNVSIESSKDLILDGITDVKDFENQNINSLNQANNTELKVFHSGIESTEKQNSIEIDAISVNGKIVEGDKSIQDSLLLQGFWLYPDTGIPDINTHIPTTPVIFGHRLFKKPPETETFYNLDQLKGGEIIRVNFNKMIYYYEVVNIRIIDKYDWAAIEPEPFDALKLLTCTPLDSFENAPFRILVTAKLLK